MNCFSISPFLYTSFIYDHDAFVGAFATRSKCLYGSKLVSISRIGQYISVSHSSQYMKKVEYDTVSNRLFDSSAVAFLFNSIQFGILSFSNTISHILSIAVSLSI